MNDYLQERAKGSTFYGFKGGPACIMKCKYVELNAEYIQPHRNQGGFDMICSGRDKIETPEQIYSEMIGNVMIDASASENAIRYIQALPKLVWLSFYNAYMGPVLCFAQGLKNLKILDIVQMKHLTQVVIEDGAMFELQKLHVRDCRGLESVPKGIENLVNLQELHLSHVSYQLVERIRGERSVDRSRVKHIPTIKHHFRNDDGSFYVSLSS
ncbi:unnamed protein product [Arabis nemorensis]|uniref:NB-ARC domain-containing protein n=1 Tax=Arabis nemorensis TaxID=586526 RepID=A0A565BZB8_9BRAS|nr:unnamed protein product [Arabis nemorensis]